MENNIAIEMKLSDLETVAAGTEEEWAALKDAIINNRHLRYKWNQIANDPSYGEDADRVLSILTDHWNLDSSYGNFTPIRFWEMGNWYHSYTFDQVMSMVKNYTPVQFTNFAPIP